MTEKPNYYAILPAQVRYSTKINPHEKLLFAEITSLCQKEEYGYCCFAKNEYFAKIYGKYNKKLKKEVPRALPTISRWINKLEKEGFICIINGKNHNRKIFLPGTMKLPGKMMKSIGVTKKPLPESQGQLPFPFDFEAGWKKYPRQTKRLEAEAAFRECITSQEQYDEWLNGIENYRYSNETKSNMHNFTRSGDYKHWNKENWLKPY